MLLSSYLQGLLSNFKDTRIVRNVTSLVHNIIEHKSIRLWSISNDKGQFERSKRLLDGSLKTVLDDAKTADALREFGSQDFSLPGKESDLLVLVHDPCDIRKQYFGPDQDR